MFLIASNTSRLPSSCSLIDSVKRVLIFFTWSESVKIVANFSPATFEEVESPSISTVNVLSVAVIVLPCAAESSASLRISSATTANPFPASPAWAASIAAFIASKFVWDAMCWITLEASIKLPDSSAIFWVTLPVFTIISRPSAVASASVLITPSVFSSVSVIDAILATISSIAEEEIDTLADWLSMRVFNCRIVLIISSTVAAVSPTLAVCVNACCFTPSIFSFILWTACAVSVIFWASSSPIDRIIPALLSIDCMEERIFLIVSLKYSDSRVTSSLPIRGSCTVKSPSPCEISFSALTAVWTGATIFAAIKNTIVSVTASMITPMIMIILRKSVIAPRNSSAGAAIIIVHFVSGIFV